MTRLPVPTEPPSAEILLLVHKDNRDTPRIRVVLTHITECIHGLTAILQPAEASGQPDRVVAG